MKITKIYSRVGSGHVSTTNASERGNPAAVFSRCPDCARVRGKRAGEVWRMENARCIDALASY